MMVVVVVIVVVVVVVEEVVQAKTSSPSRSVRAPTRNRTHVYLLDLFSYGRRDTTRRSNESSNFGTSRFQSSWTTLLRKRAVLLVTRPHNRKFLGQLSKLKRKKASVCVLRIHENPRERVRDYAGTNGNAKQSKHHRFVYCTCHVNKFSCNVPNVRMRAFPLSE
ncbi:uncharacterized protein LOC122629628 [Vespula pensylvanica]|uniref:uncharacterized protein LOC122629628 n=1 Tax=Vespula pensylvanica TaxID=30213 RepID=UPI001CBA4813|nr:uncharacterized protein LOC122629628 [Vespula pensylvanica]